MSEKSALGKKGFIMREMGGGHFFRVYDDKGGYIDYDIVHFDLEVLILDEGAVFVEHEGKHYIDYTNDILRCDDGK